MQIHNQDVTAAKAGDAVGLKVTDKVRHGDKVSKVTD
jgi:selenocysteine-specific translation elongation factor